MICRKCGTDNPEAKRSCMNCGAILEGYTVNNVTGEYGYRHADGSFAPAETERKGLRCDAMIMDEISAENWKKVERNLAFKGRLLGLFSEPVAALHHPPTGLGISVYKPIPWFQRLMPRWCFGLKYRKL